MLLDDTRKKQKKETLQVDRRMFGFFCKVALRDDLKMPILTWIPSGKFRQGARGRNQEEGYSSKSSAYAPLVIMHIANA